MDWLVGLLLVIVGGILGFFGARYYFTKYSDPAKLEAQVQESREQMAAYRKDVVEHFQTARQLAKQLSDTQSKLNTFLADSQHMLEQEKEWQQPLPFFSEDTIRQLRQANTLGQSNPLDEDNRNSEGYKESGTPRDYSDGNSGLLAEQADHKAVNYQTYSTRPRDDA